MRYWMYIPFIAMTIIAYWLINAGAALLVIYLSAIYLDGIEGERGP